MSWWCQVVFQVFPLRLFIKIYTCTQCLKGTLRLIEIRLLFGNIWYIYTSLWTAAAMCIRDSFAVWMRSAVCLLSALTAGWTAARGCWETDCLWVLLDRGGIHGSTCCSLSTVTAEWYLLSSQSLQTSIIMEYCEAPSHYRTSLISECVFPQSLQIRSA